MKYLIVVAHPDDEVLGAGASISRWTQNGDIVDVAIMCAEAKARAFRPDDNELEDDTNASTKYLGVDRIFEATFPSEYETLSAVLVYNDTRTYINLDSYVRKDEERAQKVLNELIESLDKKNFNKNINADNPCIVLNYEKYNPDNGETVLADAIIQLDGYTRTEDYISDIEYY